MAAMRTLPPVALVFLVGVLVFASTVSAEPTPSYRVIVHPKNPLASIDRPFLQDAFLKKKRHWPNNRVIQPVDLAPTAAARSTFTHEVLGRSVAAVRAYWQQRIFSGRDIPPPALTSEAGVVEYVLKHEEAIGYVSAATALAGAKTVSVNK
jgi:ABC-type phosphate transport system substrate-binding protein